MPQELCLERDVKDVVDVQGRLQYAWPPPIWRKKAQFFVYNTQQHVCTQRMSRLFFLIVLLVACTHARTCVFLHGAGEHADLPTIIDRNPALLNFGYWGNVYTYVKAHCDHQVYIRRDTYSRGWNNHALQKAFCNASTYDQAPSDRFYIRNKTLYAHSMGNDILAGAILNGFCDIDMRSTRWYAASGPLVGTEVASWIEAVCAHGNVVERKAAEELGYCEGNHAAPCYASLVLGYANMTRLRNIALRYLSGAMCGTSAYGLNSIYSIPLYTVAKLSGAPKPNDGMVSFASCSGALGNQTRKAPFLFKKNVTAKWYLTEVNHADATCRNGDGYWGSSRNPCTWYRTHV